MVENSNKPLNLTDEQKKAAAKERKTKYNRTYYEKHAQEMREKHRKYYEENKEKMHDSYVKKRSETVIVLKKRGRKRMPDPETVQSNNNENQATETHSPEDKCVNTTSADGEQS